jgi:hypothetical protein
MLDASSELLAQQPIHDWLRKLNVAYAPGHRTRLIDTFAEGLMRHFHLQGHTVPSEPRPETQLIITTAAFREPLNWRRAFLFTARRKFRMAATPTIYSIIHVRPAELAETLAYFDEILDKDPPDPRDYDFPGMAPTAFHTLHEQGVRGGSIMALARLLQSQSKSIRMILVVGEEEPEFAYLFDLVGAHPRIEALDPEVFYANLALRITTAMSTQEITDHIVDPVPIPASTWRGLSTPADMRHAAVELGNRNFFTEMVRVANLVHVPTLDDSIARQYSEGCFSTWDPTVRALVATITGSARPVEKDAISEDDLAVICGLRPDRSGVIVRHVEGKENYAPSSEAVEMMDMDSLLPFIHLPKSWNYDEQVPVVRSKLHGHRGVQAFDPNHVEFVPLEAPYYSYPVSCATEAQARGIVSCFSRSQALLDPQDPRTVAFTVLPGHGVMIAEKWVAGKRPFEQIYNFIDAGRLDVDNYIPQGYLEYLPGQDGMMQLRYDE